MSDKSTVTALVGSPYAGIVSDYFHSPLGVPDPRESIAEAPMSPLQIGIIAVLFCLNALDGFDVLAISFAVPGIAGEWGMSPGALGVVISIGLAATGVSSLVLAPLADRIGRRPMILASLAIMTVGMLVCALAPGTFTLAGGRLLTGLGVGAIVPCISALAAEYANRRYRDLAVVVVAVGFPAGALVGGTIASLLLSHFDWRSVFMAGAVTTGVLALAPVFFVPESIEHLIARRSPEAQARINAILTRLRRPTIQELPTAGTQTTGTSLIDIFVRPQLLGIALFLTLAYGLHNATLYYALNWIPKMVVDLSLSQAQAATVAAWCSGGGIIGGLAAAWLAARFNIRPLTAAGLFGTAALLWVFAHAPGQMFTLVSAAAALGAFLYGGQTSLYALMTRSFPVQVRATGVGFVTGAGRWGSILSPIISGHLLGSGMHHPQIATVMALGSLVGSVTLLFAGQRTPTT
ncbi:MAG TPA: MFS transporter [Steroidobacteraceae bacterium]|jgi:benzoate transport